MLQARKRMTPGHVEPMSESRLAALVASHGAPSRSIRKRSEA
jgi:hypothetical protein